MRLFIHKHQPLLTSNVEFTIAAPPALPSFTPLIEFTAERLAYMNSNEFRENTYGPTLEDDEGEDEDGDAPQGHNIRRSTHNAPKNIPKPPGEPGRPNSGGFCLETTLIKEGWSKKDYQLLYVRDESIIPPSPFEVFQEAVKAAAKAKLDMKQSYRTQDKAAVKQICIDVSFLDSIHVV